MPPQAYHNHQYPNLIVVEYCKMLVRRRGQRYHPADAVQNGRWVDVYAVDIAITCCKCTCYNCRKTLGHEMAETERE